jgi:periplasmic protein TonB
MAAKRLLGAIALGMATTYALLLLMSSLISSGKDAMTESVVGQVVDFVRIRQDESVRYKQREVEKPEKPQTPPPSMPKHQTDLLKINTNISTAMSFNPQLNIDTLSAGDGDYLPIVKVAPEYPRRALDRGIEGYVIVEFMVTKLGTVENAVVVKAEPPGYFERAAVKAAGRFKYKPKVINGEPVEVAGVQNKIIFQMAKDGTVQGGVSDD